MRNFYWGTDSGPSLDTLLPGGPPRRFNQSEPVTVREPGTGVVEHTRAVHTLQENLRSVL